MRFRERHQDPKATDLEYRCAPINGFGSSRGLRRAPIPASPWFVSMVGFVAGLPFLYQMVARERQIEVPKYLRPRTDTPKLTVGHGGCFGCIYSVRGAGGYQMFGITPMPIYDPDQRLADFEDFMCLLQAGRHREVHAVDRGVRRGPEAEVARRARSSPAGDRSPSRWTSSSPIPTATTPSCWRRSMAVEVVTPGLATTVQDLGRPGYYHLGIPPSGALDRFSLLAANLLVGNERGAAVLEATFLGPELRVRRRRGRRRHRRGTAAEVDGEAPAWEALRGHGGRDALLRLPRSGRARLHRRLRRHRRAGGARQPLDLRARRARRLRGPRAAGGRPLPVGATAAPAVRRRTVPEELRPGLAARARGRVSRASTGTASPTRAGRRFFDTWKVAPEADRIGYRFKGGDPRVRAARAALRRRLRPVEHRRRLLPYRLDPGARRHRADRPAPRRGVRRRLLHGRHGDLGRHGPRSASAPRGRARASCR